MGLDPAFVVEQSQHKKGQLHWYECILCENGGLIWLYDDEERIFALRTTKQTADKVTMAALGAIKLTADERLGHEVLSPPLRFTGSVNWLVPGNKSKDGS